MLSLHVWVTLGNFSYGVFVLRCHKVTTLNERQVIPSKGLFTASETGGESEKDQITNKKDQGINDKHQRKFSLSHIVNET